MMVFTNKEDFIEEYLSPVSKKIQLLEKEIKDIKELVLSIINENKKT